MIAGDETPLWGLLCDLLRHDPDNPARTRTWKNRTKICCVTDYTTGFWISGLVVAESQTDIAEFQADFVK